MQKYEYKCVAITGLAERTTRRVNSYAKDGWELIAVTWIWHYFKRPIQ